MILPLPSFYGSGRIGIITWEESIAVTVVLASLSGIINCGEGPFSIDLGRCFAEVEPPKKLIDTFLLRCAQFSKQVACDFVVYNSRA